MSGVTLSRLEVANSAALSLTIVYEEVSFSYVQFEGSLSSFHAADLIHIQFLSHILTRNILSGVHTRLTVGET